MDPNAYLNNIASDLKTWSQGDARDDITNTLKFAGTALELNKRDDTDNELICLRFKTGTFGVLVGSNKPSEWDPIIEFLIYVPTTGGKLDRDAGYERLLDLFAMSVEWANQVDANADIHSDFVDFYPTRNDGTAEDNPAYWAMPLQFTGTVCI